MHKCIYVHTVGVQKVPIYSPYNETGITVPFPFNFRAVAVFVRFQTVSVLSQEQPVRSLERPGQRNSRLFINSGGRLATVQ